PLCWSFGFCFGFAAAPYFRRLVRARFASVSFDRAAACEHHLGVILLRRSRHECRHVLKGVTISGTELCYKIDVPAKLQDSVVLTLENGVALFVRESELLQVF